MEDLFINIIENAIDMKITDVHIQVKKACSIMVRKGGKLVNFKKLSQEEGFKLINYLRYISKININYLSTPQTGSYIYTYSNKDYFLRISSLPGKNMDSIVIRILNNNERFTSLTELSPITSTTDFITKIKKENWGLFIVSGPTGSGKSTTLYTLLEEINRTTKKSIVTLEDPIEIEKDFCLQIQINKDQGIDYSTSLKQILRHDPDIIMIGEIRDEITAQLAITCALTGHLVLTTIHSGSAISTVKRLVNLGIDKIDIEDVLIGVVCQQMTFYNDNPLVLSEFLNKTNIDNILHDKKTNYTTFSKNKELLVNKGYLNEKE